MNKTEMLILCLVFLLLIPLLEWGIRHALYEDWFGGKDTKMSDAESAVSVAEKNAEPVETAKEQPEAEKAADKAVQNEEQANKNTLELVREESKKWEAQARESSAKLEDLQKQLDEARVKISSIQNSADLDRARFAAAEKFGVPSDFLQGSNAEQFEESAKRLKDWKTHQDFSRTDTLSLGNEPAPAENEERKSQRFLLNVLKNSRH